MATLETGERHLELLDGLLAELDGYGGEVDRDLIIRAFGFAARAHEGQQRRSGEPFIMHPVGVAIICAGLRLDEQTIAAALLHDV
ncbi:MAG: bifunctional (p)ppGpp synthetase/guanosine-3',5'-bis(diphosphate) 3'-pyrophosphohydrolase, partial [Actinobacteria bacterium]|nr:bifunctional (p)ppGpp synthetase/guanosine-3',5'-bis(diphosphate) 3'-pyrophosphohydrolase [Actinomycetota bacterium]